MHIKRVDDRQEFCFTSWCGETVKNMESGYPSIDGAIKAIKASGIEAKVCVYCLRAVVSSISLYFVEAQDLSVRGEKK